jgi:hypothetical protein
MLKYSQSSTVLVLKPTQIMPYTFRTNLPQLIKRLIVKKPNPVFTAVLHGDKITYHDSVDEPEIREEFQRLGFVFGCRWSNWTIEKLPHGYTLGLPENETGGKRFARGEGFLIFNEENTPAGIMYADETGNFPLATIDSFLATSPSPHLLQEV